ncbi:MAG: tetratricopeptide repeat protein [Methyloligellaceae bacterium]
MKRTGLLTFLMILMFTLPSYGQEFEESDCWKQTGEARFKACRKIIFARKIAGQKITKENWAVLHYNLALSYVEKGQMNGALRNFRAALKYNPDYEKVYGQLCHLHMQTRKHGSALKDCEKAIELNSSNAIALTNRGTIYLFRKQYDKALADYDSAIAADPKLAVAYSNRGLIYDARLEYKKALADYDKSIELNPDYSRVYYHRAVTQYKLGAIESAITDLAKSIEIDSKYRPAQALMKVLSNRKS